MRYVIVSDVKGVYLGDVVWGADNYGQGRDKAPCFPKTIGVRVMKILLESVSPLRLVEVYPDRGMIDGQLYASEDSCASVGLPRWNPILYGGSDVE